MLLILSLSLYIYIFICTCMWETRLVHIVWGRRPSGEQLSRFRWKGTPSEIGRHRLCAVCAWPQHGWRARPRTPSRRQTIEWISMRKSGCQVLRRTRSITRHTTMCGGRGNPPKITSSLRVPRPVEKRQASTEVAAYRRRPAGGSPPPLAARLN